jgi:Uma2 family endonuclease
MTFVKPPFTLQSLPEQPLPTMYDLPSEHPEDAGLPDEFHRFQADLLCRTFQPATYPIERVFVASDLNLYYDARNRSYYKRPDWFGVVDVPRKVDAGRLSFVRWQENQSPIIVVELLSPSTLEEDQGETERGRTPPSKWEVYESILRVPYYVLFDRINSNFRMFELTGTAYQELFQERLWIEALGIGLGVWQGRFAEEERQWLRWYDAEGNWIPTVEELKQQAEERVQVESQGRLEAVQREEQERQRANQAEQQVEQEREARQQAEQRSAQLAERLRAMGLDPDNL